MTDSAYYLAAADPKEGGMRPAKRLIASGILLSVLLLPRSARADLVLPPEVFVMQSVMMFVIIFALAVLARLLLLALRYVVAGRNTEAAQQEKPRRGMIARYRVEFAVALIISIAFGIFSHQYYWYSRRNRRSSSEAKSNLGAIRSTEVAYYAEWNVWVGNQPLTPVADRRGSKKKEAWVDNTRFSILGFAPEGRVYFSYGLTGTDYPGAQEGFTAFAVGDLDGDGELSVYWITSSDTEIRHSGAPF